MKTFEAGAPKRTIVIGMKRGDEIVECVNKAIEEYGIKQGVIVSGIAALSQACYHKVLDFEDKATSEIVVVKSPCEMGSMQGAIIDSKPHIHMTFSDVDGNTIAGHMEPGNIVLYLCEVVILEFEGGDITRKPNDHGLMLLADK
ncbi:MAG: DNA-binding protein [Oscillospiraceae bacterium]|nr:DNA-binding protein [Oscillospiraceae bacterium]